MNGRSSGFKSELESLRKLGKIHQCKHAQVKNALKTESPLKPRGDQIQIQHDLVD